MVESRQLAGLIGPTAMVVTASEIVNFHIWSVNIPANTYLNGTRLFVAGLSILRVHNRWKPDWTVLVTLFGWFALLLGLFRVFFPETQQAEPSMITFAGVAALFMAASVLTFKAYFGSKDQASV